MFSLLFIFSAVDYINIHSRKGKCAPVNFGQSWLLILHASSRGKNLEIVKNDWRLKSEVLCQILYSNFS